MTQSEVGTMAPRWISAWLARRSPAKRDVQVQSRRRTARLVVEQLEDRWVPSTLAVNELIDTHAVNLVTGMDAKGNVSLRSAVEAADHLGGDQTIQFDPSVFAAPQTVKLTLGFLELKGTSGDITIEGPAAGVTISGNHASLVFSVASGTAADLAGLTITAGKGTGYGGGILNRGTLTIDDCNISANAAGGASICFGGGIYNQGTLTIDDSSVSNNTAFYINHYFFLYEGDYEMEDTTVYGYGGGIYNSGLLTLNDSTVSGNVTGDAGGGILNVVKGTAQLTDCTVSGNAFNSPYQSLGGGLMNYGSASMTGCTISANKANGQGGGIDNDAGTLTIVDSVISGNSTTSANYTIYQDGGGIVNNGTATLQDSTISGNATKGLGGGICGTYDATTVLTDCTLSGNTAGEGGCFGCAGPYYSISGNDSATITDCTISGNTAKADGGGIWLGPEIGATFDDTTIADNMAVDGGGVYMPPLVTYVQNGVTIPENETNLWVNNSIIAGNISTAGNGDVAGYFQPTSVNNLIGDGDGITSGVTNGVNGNQVGTHTTPINPLLAPLGDYGGLTQTMALLPGSPAIDAGSNAAIPAGTTTDQRGQPRIVNGVVDIGAYESSQVFLPAPTDLTPSGAVPAGTGYDVPTFSWSAVPGADHYDLLVVDNTTGMTAIDVPGISGTSYAASSAQALTPGHNFTTYVFAFSADNSAFGDASESFSLAALQAPSGLTPAGLVTASSGYDTPTFSWTDLGAGYYSLKVVDNTAHTTPINVANLSSSSYATPAFQALTPGHSYTITLTAFSTNGQVKLSATQTFTLTALAAPTGIMPAGIVTASAGYDQPTFSWNAVAGANLYALVVTDNTTGATPITVHDLTGPSYTTTAAQALTPGHKFTIHVYAYSTNNKTYTVASQSFTLAALAAPTGITPAGPVPASAGSNQPTFAWSPVNGAAYYTFFVIDETTGATPIVVHGLNGVSYGATSNQTLTRGHKFTIRVYAYSTNGRAYSLGTQTFTLLT